MYGRATRALQYRRPCNNGQVVSIYTVYTSIQLNNLCWQIVFRGPRAFLKKKRTTMKELWHKGLLEKTSQHSLFRRSTPILFVLNLGLTRFEFIVVTFFHYLRSIGDSVVVGRLEKTTKTPKADALNIQHRLSVQWIQVKPCPIRRTAV